MTTVKSYDPETKSYPIHEDQLLRLEKAAHSLRALYFLLIQSDTEINTLDMAAAIDYARQDLTAICQEIGG